MNKWLSVFAITAVIALAGCKTSNGDEATAKKADDTMKMSTDACSHCPGVQTLSADGKCSACGMKVK
jgi:hypothetical protein